MSKKFKFRDNNRLYFVTFTITKWIDLFIRNDYRNIVINYIKYCQTNKGLIVYAYCIMTSHIHMILETNKIGFSDLMRDMKGFMSRKLKSAIINNDYESRKEWLIDLFYDKNIEQFNIWQPESHPIELDNNKIIDQKLEYIHNNPVEAGFVEKGEDWIHSSARDYCTDCVLDCLIYNIYNQHRQKMSALLVCLI